MLRFEESLKEGVMLNQDKHEVSEGMVGLKPPEDKASKSSLK
jgi:hypothetical protein